jgi:hypothetical protein
MLRSVAVPHSLARLVPAISALAVVASCSGAATTPTPVPISITISSSAGYMVLGETETFTAAITFSNGVSQALANGTWSSDSPALASVGASTGLVSSIGAGDVTIFVDAQGLRGTKRISVLPEYQGDWTGVYAMTACDDTGQWSSFVIICENFGVGTKLPVTMRLSQKGATITGQTIVGGFTSESFTTTALAGGGLEFEATYQGPSRRIRQAWKLRITGRNFTGTVVQTWTDTSLTGHMRLSGTLVTMSRSPGVVPGSH